MLLWEDSAENRAELSMCTSQGSSGTLSSFPSLNAATAAASWTHSWFDAVFETKLLEGILYLGVTSWDRQGPKKWKRLPALPRYCGEQPKILVTAAWKVEGNKNFQIFSTATSCPLPLMGQQNEERVREEKKMNNVKVGMDEVKRPKEIHKACCNKQFLTHTAMPCAKERLYGDARTLIFSTAGIEPSNFRSCGHQGLWSGFECAV